VDIIPKEPRASFIPGAERLIQLIENSAEELAREVALALKEHPETECYRGLTEKELHDRARRIFANLGQWISLQTERHDIARYYAALGAQRREENIPLSQVLHSFTISRRVLWQKVIEQGLLDTVYDFIQALELQHQVLLFFDRAIFFTARGYETS
jgi:hypothetical protein